VQEIRFTTEEHRGLDTYIYGSDPYLTFVREALSDLLIVWRDVAERKCLDPRVYALAKLLPAEQATYLIAGMLVVGRAVWHHRLSASMSPCGVEG
jgi:hypothetical protein